MFQRIKHFFRYVFSRRYRTFCKILSILARASAAIENPSRNLLLLCQSICLFSIFKSQQYGFVTSNTRLSHLEITMTALNYCVNYYAPFMDRSSSLDNDVDYYGSFCKDVMKIIIEFLVYYYKTTSDELEILFSRLRDCPREWRWYNLDDRQYNIFQFSGDLSYLLKYIVLNNSLCPEPLDLDGGVIISGDLVKKTGIALFLSDLTRDIPAPHDMLQDYYDKS